MPLINSFDNGITRYIKSIPESATPFFNSITVLGDPVVVVVIAVIGAFTAFKQHHSLIGKAFIATIVASAINGGLLKSFIHRTRPDTIYVTNMRFDSFSFPSGHSFGSMVVYGLLAYLAAKYLPHPWNIFSIIVASVLIFLIGVSRVYLGAHFPTDVIGGWILGLFVLWLIVKYIL
jgi:undecaprenyl-diphosphatase